ncbi:inositol 2-dehydrogenase [Pantoea sp. At-9b]|uniref:inositol 2-dehydrogenase n=1 Tax=Pantoea sp. (strain At-9b) TaxID=592316 RepID=UPI0001B40CEF|nr:inositol 2-dehydrogenase [Pantoea sp. At-9b]ADU72508.1 oxidoreductase domain protein [Pantoea sp. At-9b]
MKIAVLGAGRIGNVHAMNVASNPNVELVAIADPFIDNAIKLTEKYGGKAVKEPMELIESNAVDAVIIATPTDTHVDLMLSAARNGKAVLCEKPVDLNLERAEVACAELKQCDVPVMIAFNRRFDPSAAEMHSAIAKGEVGELHQIMISSRDPGFASMDYLRHSGGIFRDMTIHDFDMARWLLGEEPVQVFASASRMLEPALEPLNDFDTVMVQMITKSGKQCHINCSRQAVYGHDQRIEAYGSAGMLLNDNLRPSTLRRFNKSATDARVPLVHFFLERYADAYRMELEAFISAVKHAKPVPVTPYDGYMALKLADCAQQSAETGLPVQL